MSESVAETIIIGLIDGLVVVAIAIARSPIIDRVIKNECRGD